MAYYGTKKVTAYFNGKKMFIPLYCDIPSDVSVENATLAFLANMSLYALNSKLLSDFNSVIPEEEQLTAPKISLNGSILTISDRDERAKVFHIYINGVMVTELANIEYFPDIDIYSNVPKVAGTYEIAVIAKASGYLNSPSSNVVTYVLEEPEEPEGEQLKAPSIDMFDNDLRVSGDGVVEEVVIFVDDVETLTISV